jgi:HSP20 family protein
MLVRRVWPSRPTFDSSSSDFDQIRREMLRLLDTASADTGVEGSAGVFPPINISQDDDRFYVRAEVPGINPAEISISALRNRLSISGRRDIPKEHERVSYHRKERLEGTFNRTVILPAEVDADGVDARYSDGILTLTLPKAEQAKPRQITVKT